MSDANTNPNMYSTREKKASRSVTYWTLAWGLSIPLGCAIAMFLPLSKAFLSILALSIYLGVGFVAIRAHKRWLEKLDEMQRKIQLEAMAIALGTLWLAFGGLLILHSAKVIYIGFWEVSLLPALAGLGMAIGNVVGARRHR